MKRVMTALIGIVIFIVLPVVFWGIKDIDGFISHPARLGYLIAMLGLQIFTALYSPPAKHQAKPSIDLIMIQLLTLGILFIAPFGDSRGILRIINVDVLRYIGLVIMPIFFVLMEAAEKYLGKQFSISVKLQESHELVKSGPYRYIRHPRYLGIIGFFGGFALIYLSFLALIFLFVLAIVLIWRVFAEEKMLHEQFGSEWEEYRAKSWRLVPLVF